MFLENMPSMSKSILDILLYKLFCSVPLLWITKVDTSLRMVSLKSLCPGLHL